MKILGQRVNLTKIVNSIKIIINLQSLTVLIKPIKIEWWVIPWSIFYKKNFGL